MQDNEKYRKYFLELELKKEILGRSLVTIASNIQKETPQIRKEPLHSQKVDYGYIEGNLTFETVEEREHKIWVKKVEPQLINNLISKLDFKSDKASLSLYNVTDRPFNFKLEVEALSNSQALIFKADFRNKEGEILSPKVFSPVLYKQSLVERVLNKEPQRIQEYTDFPQIDFWISLAVNIK